MSTKKESPVALLLTLLVTVGLLGGVGYWVFRSLGQSPAASERGSERFSTGKRQLIKTTATPAKEAGVAALAAGDLPRAGPS